jgi:hypothetical protein
MLPPASLAMPADVYSFPTNTHESIHPDVWRYIIVITDTLLVIIPPAAFASKYESIWYANIFSMSDSFSNCLHVDPAS